MRLKSSKGFTLVELLVSVAVAGIAAALMASTLVRQQRFYSSAAAILETRAQIRDAAEVLVTDIRSAAPALGVPTLRDSAIEMFTTIASSIVCTTASPQSFGLPPLVLESGMSLTSMLAVPDTGDLALVYTSSSRDSGVWEVQRIASVTTQSISTACPAGSGLVSASDVVSGRPAYSVSLASVTANPIKRGAPVQFVRRARYSLYRSSDNKWYLGYRRCNASGPSACAAIQPVAGPFASYSGSGPGLAFRYFDRAGVEISAASSGTDLARVEIVVRHPAGLQTSLTGDGRSHHADSVLVSVAPRNRRR